MRNSVDADYGLNLASSDTAADSQRLDKAVNGLRLLNPDFCAGSQPPAGQIALGIVAAVGLPFVLALTLRGNGGLWAACVTIPFTLVVLLRLAALWHVLGHSHPASPPPPSLEDGALPVYSVLVPLYRESEVAPALIRALNALDYPPHKLEILLITEAADHLTRVAIDAAIPPPHMRIVVVPVGIPQTKPRALNFALQLCTGDLVAVFDAEDVPAPGQLRRAAQQFSIAGRDLVCLQARLGVYNPDRCFLTRQFAIEYASLFAAILPALERLGFPILLGGTSNHFRRSELEAAGAWDAYNVTEDADLAIRLARLGKRVALLDCETWEEAPQTKMAWLCQRTRWLKGWMQTLDHKINVYTVNKINRLCWCIANCVTQIKVFCNPKRYPTTASFSVLSSARLPQQLKRPAVLP